MSTDYYVVCDGCKKHGGMIFSNHADFQIEEAEFIMRHTLRCGPKKVKIIDEHEFSESTLSRLYPSIFEEQVTYFPDKPQEEGLYYYKNLLDFLKLAHRKDIVKKAANWLMENNIRTEKDIIDDVGKEYWEELKNEGN